MTQLLENGLPVSHVTDAIKGPLVIKPRECRLLKNAVVEDLPCCCRQTASPKKGAP